MKKLLLLLIIPFVSFGQTLNNIPISELDIKYLQIVGTQKPFKWFEVTINVNYGQVGRAKDAGKAVLADASGKGITFNGMMDAVNFFANYGYELEFAYPLTVGSGGSSQQVYHYIMYNPNSTNSDANDITKNRGNTNIDDLICECNKFLTGGGGATSDECQQLFISYNLNSESGKSQFKSDLKRLGCK